jgi:hypothetical protein
MEEEGGQYGWMTWNVPEMRHPFNRVHANPGESTTVAMMRMSLCRVPQVIHRCNYQRGTR